MSNEFLKSAQQIPKWIFPYLYLYYQHIYAFHRESCVSKANEKVNVRKDDEDYYYYYYYYYYTIWMSLVTGLFFLVLLLNQRWSPLLKLQASHCSTFRIMCDIPSIAVFCSESIECFYYYYYYLCYHHCAGYLRLHTFNKLCF